MDVEISVVIPNYNNGKFIAQTIKSVMVQTYTNWEAWIIDDCSVDDSVEIIEKYLPLDRRLNLYRNSIRKGVGAAKRIGVHLSSGYIIGTLGSDDTLSPDAFEVMVKMHLKHPEASLVYSTYYNCDKNLNIINIHESVKAIPENDTYLTCKYATSSTISSFRTFKKTYYLKTEGYNPFFKKAVDKDIIYKLEEVGKTVFIDTPLYYYRLHENNISRNKNGWEAFLWEVRAKEKAYYRRLRTNIPNITKDKLYGEYYFVYKNLAFESLKYREYGKYFKYCVGFLLKFKNPLKTAKFVYYTLKKHLLPSSFE